MKARNDLMFDITITNIDNGQVFRTEHIHVPIIGETIEIMKMPNRVFRVIDSLIIDLTADVTVTEGSLKVENLPTPDLPMPQWG